MSSDRLHISLLLKREKLTDEGVVRVACNTMGFTARLCVSTQPFTNQGLLQSLFRRREVCLPLFESKSLGILSLSCRSPLLPWTHGAWWPGNRLWQHLGLWMWNRNDSANVWNFDTPDRIRLWGQRPWCHGNTAEMVIKQNNSPALVWTCANNRSLSER